jgi:SNF2 family DNA or RNA helicase
MGQQRPVTIYRLVARHTIEEGIVDLHRHKRDLADSLLEGSDMAARMSPADMLAMLQAGLAGSSAGRTASVADWRSG